MYGTMKKEAKKKTANKKLTDRFHQINKAIFRLNHIIDINNEKYLLTSGDISVRHLFLELKPLINSRATFFEGELKPFSKSVPFFTNDYLTNLLDTIANQSSHIQIMAVTRLLIIDFIKEYIDNFLKLYQLAKYNILIILKNNNPNDIEKIYGKLLLQELFQENLKYTAIGRYTFPTNSPNSSALNEIKYRDILNYYCILLEYCKISLDHIHKRFKISIIKYDHELYNRNEKCEELLDNYFTNKLNITYTSYTNRLKSFVPTPKKIFGNNKNLNPYGEHNKIAKPLSADLQALSSLGRSN